MRRVCAAGIDHVILTLIGMIIMALYTGGITSQSNSIFFNKQLLIIIILGVLYYFTQDLFFQGRSFGKMLVGLNLKYKEMTIGFAMKHTFFKWFACVIWPITLIYYCSEHRMFYDRILGIREEQ